jgi:ABC-2 type transport system permease protein
MSWQAIARKDFEDAVRSQLLWGLSVLFLLLVSAAALVLGYVTGSATSSAIMNALNGVLVTTLVPLISLVVAYGAVVGERESGSLKILLSLPHSRGDVVLGKVVGRSAAMAVPVFVGFLLPGIALLLTPAAFDLLKYVGFILFVVLLATVFVAIATGISAAASTQRRAIAGVIGFYFLFVPLWVVVQSPLQLYLTFVNPEALSGLPLTAQELLRVIRLINPTGSFKMLVGAFLNDALFAPNPPGDVRVQSQTTQFAAAAMLALWTAAPPVLGWLNFREKDL